MTEPTQVPLDVLVDLVPVDFTANEILLSFTRLTKHREPTHPPQGGTEEPWSSYTNHSTTALTLLGLLPLTWASQMTFLL